MKRELIAIFLICAIIAVPLLLDAWLTHKLDGMFALGAPRTCVVGVAGSAANIQFSGDDAASVCNNAQDIMWNYQYANTLYGMDAPQGDELCAGTFDLSVDGEGAVTVTIRDSGSLDLVGNGLCHWFIDVNWSAQARNG